MHVLDHARAREHEDLVVALQIARVVAEALAPEVGLRERDGLEHGAHGAVDHEDALGEQAIELAAQGFGLHGSLVVGAGLGAGNPSSLS